MKQTWTESLQSRRMVRVCEKYMGGKCKDQVQEEVERMKKEIRKGLEEQWLEQLQKEKEMGEEQW